MKICCGFCGSFCTARQAIDAIGALKREGHDLYPVAGERFLHTDTRFGRAEDFQKEIEALCGRKIIDTVAGAEPIGPVLDPDLMIIAPLTGNTLSKIALGQSDTPVSLAAKAVQRNGKPLLLCLASNDAMGANFENLARLCQRKNIYFLPMRQDDPARKPRSLVAEFSLLPQAAAAAVRAKQLLPLFLPPVSAES